MELLLEERCGFVGLRCATSKGMGNVLSAALERAGSSTGVMRSEAVANVGSAALSAGGAACCWSAEGAPPPGGQGASQEDD